MLPNVGTRFANDSVPNINQTENMNETIIETIANLNRIWRDNSNAIFSADLTPAGERSKDPEAIYLELVAKLLALGN